MTRAIGPGSVRLALTHLLTPNVRFGGVIGLLPRPALACQTLPSDSSGDLGQPRLKRWSEEQTNQEIAHMQHTIVRIINKLYAPQQRVLTSKEALLADDSALLSQPVDRLLCCSCAGAIESLAQAVQSRRASQEARRQTHESIVLFWTCKVLHALPRDVALAVLGMLLPRGALLPLRLMCPTPACNWACMQALADRRRQQRRKQRMNILGRSNAARLRKLIHFGVSCKVLARSSLVQKLCARCGIDIAQ